jgi:hypothetical protein
MKFAEVDNGEEAKRARNAGRLTFTVSKLSERLPSDNIEGIAGTTPKDPTASESVNLCFDSQSEVNVVSKKEAERLSHISGFRVVEDAPPLTMVFADGSTQENCNAVRFQVRVTTLEGRSDMDMIWYIIDSTENDLIVGRRVGLLLGISPTALFAERAVAVAMERGKMTQTAKGFRFARRMRAGVRVHTHEQRTEATARSKQRAARANSCLLDNPGAPDPAGEGDGKTRVIDLPPTTNGTASSEGQASYCKRVIAKRPPDTRTEESECARRGRSLESDVRQTPSSKATVVESARTGVENIVRWLCRQARRPAAGRRSSASALAP